MPPHTKPHYGMCRWICAAWLSTGCLHRLVHNSHTMHETGQACIKEEASLKQAETNLNVILGALVGAVAAACVGLLLFYLKKHPKKAMKANTPAVTMPFLLACTRVPGFAVVQEFYARRIQTGNAGACDYIDVYVHVICIYMYIHVYTHCIY